MACGPRRGDARGAAGLWSPGRARERGGSDERGPNGSGRGRETRGRQTGPGGGNWAGGIEERKKGRAEILGRKRNFSFFFQTQLNKIQIKFKLKEFEFKLNHKHLKQCKVAWMHNNKTTSFNFIKPTNHYLFLLNSLWRKQMLGKF